MTLIERGVLFQLFWLPAAVSAGVLLLLWVQDSVPRHASALVGWCLLAAALQVSASTPLVWAGGLVLQTALAVVLFIKYQLGRI